MCDERWLRRCVGVREEIVLLVKKENVSMHLFINARRELHGCWQCCIPHMYTVDDFTGVIVYKCINAVHTADSRGMVFLLKEWKKVCLPLHIQSLS